MSRLLKAKSFFPPFTFIIISSLVYHLWYLDYQEKNNLIHARTEMALKTISIRINESINNHLHILRLIRSVWKDGYLRSSGDFNSRILDVLNEYQGFQSINFINKMGVITLVVPVESNIGALGKNLHDHPIASATFMISETKGIDQATPPLNLFQGGKGFATYFPIKSNQEIEGYINGVFKFEHFLNYSLENFTDSQSFSLEISDDNSKIVSESTIANDVEKEFIKLSAFPVLNRTWMLTLIPKSSLIDVYRKRGTTTIYLLLGLFASLIISLMVHRIIDNREKLHESVVVLQLSETHLKESMLQQEKILETAKFLASSLDSKEVLSRIATSANELVESKCCIIFMVDENEEYLIPAVVIDLDYEDIYMSTKVRVDSSFSGQAVLNGETIIFNDAYENETGYYVPKTGDDKDDRILISPLKFDNEVKGVMLLRRIGKLFTSEESILIDTFAAHASLALRNANQLQKIKEEVENRTTLEKKLSEAQKLETIGRLAGGIAHDFNNILTPMFVHVDMALDDVEIGSPIFKNLTHILKGSERAKDLVKQILTFSRQSDHVLNPLDICLAVSESIKLLRSTIPSTIQLISEIEEDAVFINGDETQIHQIIMNLVANSSDALKERSGKIIISVKVIELKEQDILELGRVCDNKCVLVTISDNGPGINDLDLQRVFDPFFTTKEIGKGTGLGLSVVHGIVTDHGGDIRVESTHDQGTTFKIYFPVISIGNISTQESPKMKLTGNETILIIDDEPGITDSARFLLEKLGYTVITENEPKLGLKYFEKNVGDIDLVITDFTMPGMTGDKLAEKISLINPIIPIIVTTGFSDKISDQDYKRYGFNDYLMKPFGSRELGEAIRKLLC